MKKRLGLKKNDSKSNKIWKILDDIKIHKKGNLLDDPSYKKEFNIFILLRSLSMDPDLIPMANLANEYQGSLDKEHMYKFLISIIPQTTHRPKWIKNISTDIPEIKDIMEYFKCNRREAVSYYERFGEDWAKEISMSFGGLRK